MNTFARFNKNKNLPSISVVIMGMLLLVISSLGLQGCKSSSGGGATVADPKGYYDTGFAEVKQISDNTTDLTFNDLLGMVSGNRFMLMSTSQVLLYDGTITEIIDNTYTATVNIYKDGVLLPDTATVAGTINTGVSMEGALTGVGVGNGRFSISYSLNNAPSDLTRIDIGWFGEINGFTESESTFIDTSGNVTRTAAFALRFGFLDNCDYDTPSNVQAIPDVNVYNVTMELINCTDSTANGTYTGFITTQEIGDFFLIMAYTNGKNSASGVMEKD